MRLIQIYILCLLVCILAQRSSASGNDWPQFRGHRAAGVADGAGPPTTWDVAAAENVAWKTPIPGLGHASPIVIGNRVFIVTAEGSQPDPDLRVGLYGDIASVADEGSQAWHLYCLAKHNGAVLWKRTLHQGVPKIKRHTKASHANATPASDGEYVVVALGSEGLYCYDLCGNQKWKRDLGVLDSGYYVAPAAQWGFASSPIIYRDRVIVQCDVQENSFLAAFALRSGAKLWQTPREDVPTWSTPAIFEHDGHSELIVNGYRHTGGYDLETGDALWRIEGGGDIPVPTPIIADDLVIFSSAHGKSRPLYALRPGLSGPLTLTKDAADHEHVAWYKPRDGIYMQTPIVYGEYLYACHDTGVLSCYETRTGKRMYRQRLGKGGFTASPVAADGKLYFTSEDGMIHVVSAGATFERIAENEVGEVCMATPAISRGLLIVRGKRHVFAFGNAPPGPPVHVVRTSVACPPPSCSARPRCRLLRRFRRR